MAMCCESCVTGNVSSAKLEEAALRRAASLPAISKIKYEAHLLWVTVEDGEHTP